MYLSMPFYGFTPGAKVSVWTLKYLFKENSIREEADILLQQKPQKTIKVLHLSLSHEKRLIHQLKTKTALTLLKV